MNYSKRAKLYKEIEDLRGNPLIVYKTSNRKNAHGVMGGDCVDEFISQAECLPKNSKEIDLLVDSRGGDGLVAWRIISLLRSKVDKINILIPDTALSAATILALGGDSIVMGKYACLGPIDPQIEVKKEDGTKDVFAYEDVLSLFELTKTNVGLTEQEHQRVVFEKLTEAVNPVALGFAKRASSLAIFIGEKLLLTHMDKKTEQAEAKEIAVKLNKNYFNHGHTLYRDEAKAIGLQVQNADEKIEHLMLEIRNSFREELVENKPFLPLAEFFKDPNSKPYYQNLPAINIPNNINQQIVQKMLIEHINKQLNQNTPDVTLRLKYAFIESLRTSSTYTKKVRILVDRSNSNFKASVLDLDAAWVTKKIVKPIKKKPTKRKD